MGEENLPDSNTYKTFALHETDDVRFERDEYGIHVILTRTLPGENNYSIVTFLARGNIYVLNDAGKTVESVAIGKVKPYPECGLSPDYRTEKSTVPDGYSFNECPTDAAFDPPRKESAPNGYR